MDSKNVRIKWMGNTKLMFKYQISEKAQIKAEVLNERAMVQLQDDGYKIIEGDRNKIFFDDSGGPFMKMRGIRLDEGVVEFKECDGITTAKLTYFVKYRVFLVSAVALIIYSCFTGFINLFGEILLLIAFAIENFNAKKLGKQLFEEIIG